MNKRNLLHIVGCLHRHLSDIVLFHAILRERERERERENFVENMQL